MSNVFLIMLASILTENFIFVRFFGVSPFLKGSKKPLGALGTSAVVIFVMTLSSVLCFAVNDYILAPLSLEHLRTVAFVLVTALIGELSGVLVRRFIPSLHALLDGSLLLITANCAVLGAVLLNVQNGSSFTDSVAFGFASALGFALATLIFAGVRAKMQFSDVPKSFKGLPILLIAAGLVALAFSGFYGMKFN